MARDYGQITIIKLLRPPRESWAEILWEIKTFKNSCVYGRNKKGTSGYKICHAGIKYSMVTRINNTVLPI